MAKVSEQLGLAGNVKLESGVFNKWEDNQVSVGDLFYLNNRDLSKFDLNNTCGNVSWHEQRRLEWPSQSSDLNPTEMF